MSSYNFTRSEKDVGITLYLGNQPRFSAALKQRYSDFHVNEIDPSGNIVHLTSLDPPIDNQVQVAVNDPEVAALIPESVRTAVADLQRRLTEKSRSEKIKDAVEIKVTEADKDARKKIHKWISCFDKLSSETIEKGNDKFIKVVALTSNPRMHRRPDTRAKYTHCLMFKEGVETSAAIGFLAQKLTMKPSLISYAGIKDKRAKTTQRISISNIDANRLAAISKFARGIKLGNFEYQPRPISLGDLKGNHFRICLKDVKVESDNVIQKAVESLKTQGFINYYGMQRFGSYDVSTYEVGKKLLQQNWLEAFDMILKVKPKDHDFMIKAKELWLKERNAEAAVEAIPSRHRSIESHLLHGLARFYSRNDCCNAFIRVPRHVRLLYIHAYQSFLWNRMASYRIQEYGMKPVVGDLVYVDPEQADGLTADNLNIDEVGAIADESIYVPEVPYHQKLEVKLLTEEDINEGTYSVYDVLIPLHGSDIKLPSNKTKDYLDQILKKEGIEEESFLRYRPITDAPKGAYRKIVVLPKNVTHKIMEYSDSDDVDSFIPSDLDILQSKTSLKNPIPEETVLPTTTEANLSGPEPQHTEESKPSTEISGSNTSEEKTKKCVILEFSLPSSSYATMALREVIDEEKFVGQPGPMKNSSDADQDEPAEKKKKLDLE